MELLIGGVFLPDVRDFEYHSLFFTIIILALAFSVILKMKKVFLLELIILLSAFIFEQLMQGVGYIFLLAIQILLGILLIYKYKKAAKLDYLLILEKTHRIPSNLTKEGNLGNRPSLFR